MALVRKVAARSIAIWASWTVTTALSGSVAVPVASDWAAPAALCWVLSKEEMALEELVAEARRLRRAGSFQAADPAGSFEAAGAFDSARSFDPARGTRSVQGAGAFDGARAFQAAFEARVAEALAGLAQAVGLRQSGAVDRAFGQFARQAADRWDDHLSSPNVVVNIDLAVCIAVTSDW